MFFPRPNSLCHPPSYPCSRVQVRASWFRWLGAAALWLVITTSSVIAQPMTVSGFSPSNGAEDTLVNVTGTGFATDPADQWAFVHDPLAGLGVVIDPLAGNETSWTGVLGPAPGPFTGTLTLWKGIRWELPTVVIAGESGAYLVRRADWFVRWQSADGPGTFTVNQSSGGTIGAINEAFAVAVDFSSFVSPDRIDLNVVIDGGSDNNTGGGGEDLQQRLKRQRNGGADPARALRLEIHNVEPVTATPEAVARDVGTMLTRIYGAFGLRTSVQGAKLYIQWKGAPQIHKGFAVLRWQSQ